MFEFLSFIFYCNKLSFLEILLWLIGEILVRVSLDACEEWGYGMRVVVFRVVVLSLSVVMVIVVSGNLLGV